MLEAMGHGGLDITCWVDWFLKMLDEALLTSENLLAGILKRHDFWSRYESEVSERERDMLGLFLSDTWQGNLTSGKYAKLAKVSQDTATRDLQHLVDLGALEKRGDGRSTHYVVRTVAS
jgi:Fic family protein